MESKVLCCGPGYGYYANASKTWLVIKQEHVQQANELFVTSGMQITVKVRRHLGATLGTKPFKEAYVKARV